MATFQLYCRITASAVGIRNHGNQASGCIPALTNNNNAGWDLNFFKGYEITGGAETSIKNIVMATRDVSTL